MRRQEATNSTGRVDGCSSGEETKVFWFFSSEKNYSLTFYFCYFSSLSGTSMPSPAAPMRRPSSVPCSLEA